MVMTWGIFDEILVVGVIWLWWLIGYKGIEIFWGFKKGDGGILDANDMGQFITSSLVDRLDIKVELVANRSARCQIIGIPQCWL